MGEFKGTKGKIRISGVTEGTPQQFQNTVIYKDDILFAKVYGRTKEECEANAKIISFDTEMLEMLEQIIKESDLDIVKGIDKLKIKELIKKATEL